ncbi:unnamed protein product [Lathyrus sativus]|nr:unnamed protein product [Lathyrus sativus]
MGSYSTLSSNSTMKASSSEAEVIHYLFGGLAVIFGVITLSLLIISCYFWKQFLSFASSNDEEKSSNMHVMDTDQVVSEAEIVVIMPGETNPTYFAKPDSSISHPDHQDL